MEAEGEEGATSQSNVAGEGDRQNVQQVQGDLWGQILGVNMGQIQLLFDISL